MWVKIAQYFLSHYLPVIFYVTFTYNFKKFLNMSTKKYWQQQYRRHIFNFYTSFGKFICCTTFFLSFMSFRLVLKILDRGLGFTPCIPQYLWKSPSKIGLKSGSSQLTISCTDKTFKDWFYKDHNFFKG